MRAFAKTIFEIGQTIPANQKIEIKSNLPGRNAVTSAVHDISNSYLEKFVLI